jgi:hypothetical protein
MLNSAAGVAGCANILTTTVPSRFGKLQLTTGLDAEPARPGSPTNVRSAVAGPFATGASVAVPPGVVDAGTTVVLDGDTDTDTDTDVVEPTGSTEVTLDDLVEPPHATRTVTRTTASRPIRPTRGA